MRTMRAVLLIAVLAALAAPAAATAKEIRSATVCGTSGCNDVTGSDRQWIVGSGDSVNSPGVTAPYYRVTAVMGDGQYHSDIRMAWFPSLHSMRAVDEVGGSAWTFIRSPEALAALTRATRGLEPYRPAGKAAPASSGDGFDALPWLLGAAAAALVVGVGLLMRRRIRIPRFPEA